MEWCVNSLVWEDWFDFKDREWIVDKRVMKHTTTNMANKMHNHTYIELYKINETYSINWMNRDAV